MKIGNLITEIHQFKFWFKYGGELFWIRLRLLRLDAVEQIRSIILLVAAISGICVLFFLGIISFLFMLNTMLSEEAKAWAFCGTTLFCLIASLILFIYIIKLWHKQGDFMKETLQSMHEDFNYLHHPSSEEHRHD